MKLHLVGSFPRPNIKSRKRSYLVYDFAAVKGWDLRPDCSTQPGMHGVYESRCNFMTDSSVWGHHLSFISRIHCQEFEYIVRDVSINVETGGWRGAAVRRNDRLLTLTASPPSSQEAGKNPSTPALIACFRTKLMLRWFCICTRKPASFYRCIEHD